MDDSTHSMQKVKSFEDLSRYFLTYVQRQSFVVVPFDDFQQIASKYLEYHTKVITVV